jgi:LysM repeat protein
MHLVARLSLAIALLTTCPCLAAPARTSMHVVQPGQKLASIAKRYGLTLTELCGANGLKRNSKIHPGQRLAIPEPGSEIEINRFGTEKSEPGTSGKDRNSASVLAASYRTTSAPSATRYEGVPRRRGFVRVIGYHGDWQGQLVDHRNRVVPKSAAAVSRILAWPHKDFRMNEKLLMLLAQVSDHFGGRPLRVVSGYRTTSWVEESKHPLGRACDFVVLGVPNKVVRDYLRSLESVGVGYYPNSTFVHLDVRDRTTYWVDYAGPGEPPRLTPTAVIPKDPTATAALEPESRESHDEPVEEPARSRSDLRGLRAERSVTTSEREEPQKPRTERTDAPEPEARTLDVADADD